MTDKVEIRRLFRAVLANPGTVAAYLRGTCYVALPERNLRPFHASAELVECALRSHYGWSQRPLLASVEEVGPCLVESTNPNGAPPVIAADGRFAEYRVLRLAEIVLGRATAAQPTQPTYVAMDMDCDGARRPESSAMALRAAGVMDDRITALRDLGPVLLP